MYDQIITNLRAAYSADKANERDKNVVEPWKIAERQHFLSVLQQEGKKTLLEVGAGTGRDSKFFQDHGLQVTSTDLSPEMVKLCQQKGLTAYVMDFLSLDFPEQSFDALYALNCLLHVPSVDLSRVLHKLYMLLKPGGLFFLGIYGGIEREGSGPDDNHEPKRFFSYHTDEYMQRMLTQYFQLVSFKPIQLPDTRRGGSDPNFHFQSFLLRRSI